MEKEFKDILLAERTRRKATQRQMADHLGISEKMYSQYESGKYTGGPTKVAKYLDKLYGKKSMSYSAEIDSLAESAAVLNETQVAYGQRKNLGIPVYDVEFTAGFLSLIKDSPNAIVNYISIPEVKGCDCIVRARGDSMSPKINDKDLIGLKIISDLSVIVPGLIYGIVTNDMELLKYVRKSKVDGNILLTSENSNYDDFDLPMGKVLELYLVKTVIPIKTII